MFDQIKSEDCGDYTLFTLRGQFIGGDETDRLRQLLSGVAEQQDNIAIVDLANVTYINSTALGVLISAHARFTKRNGRVVLCNISDNIENIFIITKLTLVFEIYDTVDQAKSKISES